MKLRESLLLEQSYLIILGKLCNNNNIKWEHFQVLPFPMKLNFEIAIKVFSRSILKL